MAQFKAKITFTLNWNKVRRVKKKNMKNFVILTKEYAILELFNTLKFEE